ncbi:MAG: nucleotide sugar dehydrogenase [Phycisphaerales bacterium]|nr:nucleotide sugar dehydrogenase [Phycisphaerales bacterium]
MSTVGIIGLGYVGLPLCKLMCDAGHGVIGFDIDPKKVELLRSGRCYLAHLYERFGRSFLCDMLATTRFTVESETARYTDCDALVLCVPTPLTDDRKPDLSFVVRTVEGVAERLAVRGRPQLVVLESTTYPRTTRDVVKPILDRAGVPFRLAFSPEREDPGGSHDGRTIPKLVGGIDAASRQAAVELYATAFETVIPVGGDDGGAEVAEAAKLLENIYRSVNIALVNELKIVLDAMDIDVWDVIDAAATKPFGFARFTPGPGLGGHCIPIDPYYLSSIAQKYGEQAHMIELAGRINTAMPLRVAEKTLDAIGHPRPDSLRRVLILGLAYKPNIDDVRESPSFELIRLLTEAGCEVQYSDPHVPSTHPMRQWGDLRMHSIALTADSVSSFDAVVVSTAHDGFDWDLIARHAKVIIDTRNALAGHITQGRLIKA